MSDMRQEPEPPAGPPEAAPGGAGSPLPERTPEPTFAASRYHDSAAPAIRHMDLSVPADGTSEPANAVGPAVPADLEHPRFVRRERPRRRFMPIFLFVATCVSTFWAGTTNWDTLSFIGNSELSGRALLLNWPQGITYMCAVLAILLTHELGHFFQAVRYGIPASLPYFLPMPFTPLGTMGAVISMNGLQANRRELFDIGISGPIAGLLVAVPVSWIGIAQAQPFVPPPPGFISLEPTVHAPLLFQYMIAYLRPATDVSTQYELNPWLMAGWVGMLITGLNMMPVSQLDGGHVIYALFGRGAHWIARIFLFLAVAAMVVTHTYIWMLMVIVVFMIGPDHPPTADDEAPLGPLRWALGLASLAIPVFCFPPLGLSG